MGCHVSTPQQDFHQDLDDHLSLQKSIYAHTRTYLVKCTWMSPEGTFYNNNQRQYPIFVLVPGWIE
jgi:hypothetical protein